MIALNYITLETELIVGLRILTNGENWFDENCHIIFGPVVFIPLCSW
jgi:hypothetical protein